MVIITVWMGIVIMMHTGLLFHANETLRLGLCQQSLLLRGVRSNQFRFYVSCDRPLFLHRGVMTSGRIGMDWWWWMMLIFVMLILIDVIRATWSCAMLGRVMSSRFHKHSVLFITVSDCNARNYIPSPARIVSMSVSWWRSVLVALVLTGTVKHEFKLCRDYWRISGILQT